MRPFHSFRPAAFLLALVALAGGGMAAPPAALAADLDRHYSGYSHNHHFPPYFGLYEPWSRSSERPPRRGVWFRSGKPDRTVNFLVPMYKWRDYVRPEPWTPAWFRYCADRWPSFNPRTGTIVTPDGVRMCL